MGDSKMCMQALSDCLSNGFNSFEAMKTVRHARPCPTLSAACSHGIKM
jgi:hypothetical protein